MVSVAAVASALMAKETTGMDPEASGSSPVGGKAATAADRPATVWKLPAVAAALIELLRPLARYHRHEVEGLEQIPKEGGALLVLSHSLATYDGLLLGLAIFEATGRLPTGLAGDVIFRIPVIGELARQAGLEPASPGNGVRLLRAGRMVCVAPGGMREALRPTERRYQISWARRRGFVRLALRAQVPLVLAACPAADDIFTVVDNPVTPVIYELFKLPLPLFFGRRKMPVPRQIKLVHRLSEPIVPPPHEPEHEDRQVEELHQRVLERMERLIEAMRASEA